MNFHFFYLLIYEKLSTIFSRPKYLLDENILFNNVTKPKCLFVKSTNVVYSGASDDEVFVTAKKRNLIIITRDVRFVLNTLLRKENIIYETNTGERYFINGKSTKFIGKNISDRLIKWPSKNQKRMLDFSNRIPFCLPLNGFYLVSVF